MPPPPHENPIPKLSCYLLVLSWNRATIGIIDQILAPLNQESRLYIAIKFLRLIEIKIDEQLDLILGVLTESKKRDDRIETNHVGDED